MTVKLAAGVCWLGVCVGWGCVLAGAVGGFGQKCGRPETLRTVVGSAQLVQNRCECGPKRLFQNNRKCLPGLTCFGAKQLFLPLHLI